MSEDRYTRQSEIFKPNDIKYSHALVIGVGAIGRQVALQLTSIGVGEITIVDYDQVEQVNLGPQGYFQSDIGKPKVQATAELMRQSNPDVEINEVFGEFSPDLAIEGEYSVVFLCVDSMEARRQCWNWLRKARATEILIDGRMAAETFLVFAMTDLDEYRTTLIDDADSYEGRCTSKSTTYCSNISAGFMVLQWSKYLRFGEVMEPRVGINLLAMTFLDIPQDFSVTT